MSERASPPQRGAWNESRQSTQASRGLFLLFFVVGAIVIAVGKSLALHFWIVTGVPVALLVVFAVASHRFYGPHEAVGDSAYYLGFLFTLLSISMALYQFNADLDAEAAGAFVHNFGVALFTTIAGLVLRVLFAQQQQDPDEIERAARVSLAQAANELSKEIVRSAEDVRGFGQKVVASYRDSSEIVLRETAASMRAVTHDVRQTVGEANSAIKAVANEIRGSAGEIREELKSSFQAMLKPVRSVTAKAEQINDALESVITATARVAARIDAIEVPPDILTQKLQEVFSVLSSAVGEHVKALRKGAESWEEYHSVLRTNAETMRAIDVAGKGFAESLRASASALEVIDASLPALARLAAMLAQLSDPIERLGDHATAFAAAVAAAVADVTEHIDAMKSHRALLAAELEVVSEQTKTLRAAAAEFAGSVTEHGDNLKKAAEAQAGAVKEFTKMGGILRDVEPALGKVVVTATAMGDAVTPVEAATRNFRELAVSLETLGNRLSQIAGAASQHQTAFSHIAQTMEADAVRVRQHREAVDAEVQQARIQLQQFHQALLGLADVITNELNASGS